jgi:hypothetical protein
MVVLVAFTPFVPGAGVVPGAIVVIAGVVAGDHNHWVWNPDALGDRNITADYRVKNVSRSDHPVG